jgi:hypothetical protein
MALAGEGGAFHAKGASLRLDRPTCRAEAQRQFPRQSANGLPTIQGAILLCDGETGALLAMIDSIEVTLRRTAAATALAGALLARPDSAHDPDLRLRRAGARAARRAREILPLRPLLRLGPRR